MIKGIIFDFDGVIVESVNIKTIAFKKIYKKYGNEIVNKVVDHHLSNGGMSRFEKFNYYHKNFLGINLNENELLSLCGKFSKLVLNDILSAPYVPGASEFLKKNNKKYNLFISTGTPQSEIEEILIRKNIYQFFKSVYGSPEKKTKHIKKIIKNGSYTNKQIVFVGDADSDISASKNHGISIIF